ncbi:hypothetical protein R6Q59_021142 [Mikania micrantha]
MKKIVSVTSKYLTTMEKHVIASSTPLGISNKNPKKRTVLRKNKKHATKDLIFNKVVSYLISDSYMYNPLVSRQPTFDFTPPSQIFASTGIQEDVALPIKGRNKKLFEKVIHFLEADCYFYSPLITDEQVCSKKRAAVKNSGGQMQTRTVKEYEDLGWQLGANHRKSAVSRGPVKHMIH